MSWEEIWEQLWQSFETWLQPATDWIQGKPLYALVSILANIIQVGAFIFAVITLRQSRKKEREEKTLREQQLQTNKAIQEQLSIYEEMFKKTKIAVKLEEELEGNLVGIREKIQKAELEIENQNLSIQERERIKNEKEEAIRQLEDERKKILAQKLQDIKHFEERLQNIVATAQNEALREVIKKRLEMLQRELNEINELKTQYQVKDDELDLPEDVKEDLKTSFRELIPAPKEDFPQSYLMQMVLIVLMIFILPFPADYFILIVAIVPIYLLVIEAVKYLKNEKITWSLQKGYKLLLFVTLYALWFGIFSWLHGLLQPFIDQAYEFIATVFNVSATASNTIPTTGCTDDSYSCLPSASSMSYSIYFILLMKISKIALDMAPYGLPLLFSAIGYVRAIKPIREKMLEFEKHEK